ncbi:MAG: SMC family ATPase [Thermoanaerobaculia bacterium]|nr:SMC family ATPase [Thermoanaerobaculia bacterium]
MILNNIKLANYKQYAALSLDFREGLVGIIGKNGAGKSTIFEAILYCLFGRDESNKILVRSSFADPKANVELALEFTIGESLYRVRREFRGKAMAVGAELFKNDQLIAKGVSAVNDELVKALHIERDAFKRSVFSGQKELDELSKASKEERRKIVRRMLGLDRLDDIQAQVNSDIRELKFRIAGQEQNLLGEQTEQALQKEIAEDEKSLKQNKLAFEKENKNLRAVEEKYRTEKQKFDEEEGRLKRLNALSSELGQLQERLAGLRSQQEILLKKSRDLERQREKLDIERGEFSQFQEEKKRLGELEKDRQRHINRSARLDKIAETHELLREVQAKMDDHAKQLSLKPEIESALAEKQKSIADLEAEMEARRNELRGLDRQIGGIEKSVSERSEKLNNLRALGRGGQCPTCFQPLLEGYERALAELENDISVLQTQQLQQFEKQKKAVTETGLALKRRQALVRGELDKLLQEQTRLTEIARQYSAEENQRRHLEARLTADEAILREIGEIDFDESAYSALKEKIEATEPRFLEFSKEENYVARELPATLAALKDTETAISEAGKNIAAKSAELGRVGYDATRYEAAKQALTGFADAFNAQSEVVRNLEKYGIELKNSIALNQEKLRANERIKTQISDKLAEIELLRKLAEMLGLFKTEILEKVSPGISREASDLFSRITKDKYESIRVDENFEFAIADGGIFYPIERFSGGEIDLANFCLRIAITKAIMDLSGTEQGIGFLAFDEIFGSQDEERRLEMMLALNYLQEQFRQIYIVSHIESLKDYFPNLLEVTHLPEGSVAKWV